MLKIEAAVDRDGRVAAVRCRAALDEGVEAVFEGTASGYRLKRRPRQTQARRQAPAEERRRRRRRPARRGALSAEAPRGAASAEAGWSVFWRR
jgi:hypothetical protein